MDRDFNGGQRIVGPLSRLQVITSFAQILKILERSPIYNLFTFCRSNTIVIRVLAILAVIGALATLTIYTWFLADLLIGKYI